MTVVIVDNKTFGENLIVLEINVVICQTPVWGNRKPLCKFL